MSHTDETSATPAPRRRWRRWLLGLILVLPLLLALGVLWVLKTGTGRDLALSQVARFLPPDVLSWRAAEGSLLGGLVLHDVRYAADGVVAELARVELDVSGAALAAGDIHIRQLRLHDGYVQWPPGEETDADGLPEQFRLPESLPALVLPMNVRVDAFDARNIRLQQGDENVLDLHRMQAAAAMAGGVFNLRDVVIESDRIGLGMNAAVDTARHWKSNITASTRLSIEGAEPLPLNLHVQGDLNAMQIKAEADVGSPLEMQLNTRGGLANPDWTLQLDTLKLLPERLGLAGEPMQFSLRGEGNLDQAELSGSFVQGELDIVLQASRLAYRNGVLSLDPLSAQLYQGVLDVRGDINFAQPDPQLDLALDWKDIILPGSEADGISVRSQGKAQAQGTLDSYALNLNGLFARDKDEARLLLEGQGSLRDLRIDSLSAQLPTGSLKAEGHVTWEPAVEARLDAHLQAFDPAYFVPDFPGAIHARLALQGGIGDAGPYGELQLDELSGHLRQRALSGSARAQADQKGHGDGQINLRLGDSQLRVQGRWDDSYDIEAQLDPVQLADLLPDARGQTRGRISLRGPRNSPSLTTQLDGSDIHYLEQRIERLRLRSEITDWDRGSLSLEASDADIGGQRLQTLALSGEGSRAKHTVSLAAQGPLGALSLDIAGALDDRAQHWRGSLDALQVEPAERSAWRLRSPAELAYALNTGHLSLSHTCLEAAPAALCAEIRSTGSSSEGRVELTGMTMSELDPLLSSLLEQPVALTGQLTGEANFSLNAAGDISGQARLSIPRLGLKFDATSERDLLNLSDVQMQASLDPASASLQLNATASDTGHIRARLDTAQPMQDDGSLQGEVDLSLPDLLALELFTDQVTDPSGQIKGRLAIGGTRSAPQLDGALELVDFSAELPALGIAPRQGHITLSSNNAERAQLSGSLKLGDGEVTLDGYLDLAGADGPSGKLNIRGDSLTVMHVPEAHVQASPDLRLELGKNTLKVRGDVTVPFAQINLERLDSVTTASSDVVIIDEADSGSGLAIDTDVRLTLGDRVRMNGFGLKGTLTGQLRLRDRPGRVTTVRGAIDVGGAYKAYGQDLTITRGQVAWASTPIDMPTLDIRAHRKIDAITVGVQVRGTALVPELSIWSEPAMEQAEQLSYLVLGRPLRSASQADGAQLTQAAAAMGGNLLAKTLGARMGLDEVEVADNRALGGAALTVGMHLSPRLHVSYGVALFGSGQVVTFKYLLSRLWNIQIDSGTENRAALNYRLER